MECDICDEAAVSRNPVFPCDYCATRYCKQCANLTSSEVKVLELKESRMLKFRCKKCIGFDSHTLLGKRIEDKQRIIEDKEEIICLLRQKIKDLETSQAKYNTQVSYSEALQRGQSSLMRTNINVPSIIIKPKQQQNSNKTEADIKKTIIPADLKVSIKSTRITKDGGFLIKCQNKKDIDILKLEADKKLKEYDTQITKMKWPRFKIVGFSGVTGDEQQIARSIMEQNHILEDQSNIKITFIRKSNRNTGLSTIFGECSPTVFQRLMNLKKIYIHWQRYPIYENLDIVRCFKCQQHYHKLDKCENKEICEYCAEEHHVKNCQKSHKKCVNCVIANEKYKVQYNIHHEASDPECPAYKYQLNILRGKIDYGNGNGL